MSLNPLGNQVVQFVSEAAGEIYQAATKIATGQQPASKNQLHDSISMQRRDEVPTLAPTDVGPTTSPTSGPDFWSPAVIGGVSAGGFVFLLMIISSAFLLARYCVRKYGDEAIIVAKHDRAILPLRGDGYGSTEVLSGANDTVYTEEEKKKREAEEQTKALQSDIKIDLGVTKSRTSNETSDDDGIDGNSTEEKDHESESLLK